MRIQSVSQHGVYYISRAWDWKMTYKNEYRSLVTDDLFSWEKEQAESKEAGQKYVFNAIWVITRERLVSEDPAKDICAREIRNIEYASEFCVIAEEIRRDEMLSKDVRAYVEAVKFSCSGDLVWSMYCPRYHRQRV